MAKDNLAHALGEVLKHEGGYVDHPADPGGATNLGITIVTLTRWLGRPATKAQVKTLTVKDVAPIYRKNYWDRVRGDALPAGLDYAVLDFPVNSGPDRAAGMLQTIVGVPVDGVIGPITLGAIDRIGATTVIGDLCSQRMAFLQRLPTWPTFGKGWSRRVAAVRAEALSMAQSGPAKPTPPAQPGSQPGSAPPEPGRAPALIIAAIVLAALVAAFFITQVRF